MKKTWMLLFAAALCFALTACSADDTAAPTAPTVPEETTGISAGAGDLVILFTGGLDSRYEKDGTLGVIGYASLEAYEAALEENGAEVVLVDGGNSIAPQEPGDRIWEITDEVGYDIRVPGARELTDGVQALQERADGMEDVSFISCNLTDLVSGGTVFAPYVIVEAGAQKIAFIGITGLEAEAHLQTGEDPTVVQYSLCLEDAQSFYDAVQQTIDNAVNDGADFVIAVSNLGTDLGSSPWTAPEVIANTTGLSVWLDCGGALLDGDMVTDMDGFEIPVCAVGSGFYYIGQITMDLNDGAVSVELLKDMESEDDDIRKMAEDLTADLIPETQPITEPTEETSEELMDES